LQRQQAGIFFVEKKKGISTVGYKTSCGIRHLGYLRRKLEVALVALPRLLGLFTFEDEDIHQLASG
jgi:hypothetical protein